MVDSIFKILVHNVHLFSVLQIYGAAKPIVREGGSFNAKKKFFEKEIQEQEKPITQGKCPGARS